MNMRHIQSSSLNSAFIGQPLETSARMAVLTRAGGNARAELPDGFGLCVLVRAAE
jgi:hypothetical protein